MNRKIAVIPGDGIGREVIPAGLGIAPMFGWGTGGGSPFSCGGACMRLFGTWHQDGPLVNYGPYSGYYPFEPYGPWTADLRYTGPRTRMNSGGGCSTCGGLLHRGGGCSTCGHYAFSTFRNVFSRLHPFGRCQSAGCSQPSGCGSCAQ